MVGCWVAHLAEMTVALSGQRKVVSKVVQKVDPSDDQLVSPLAVSKVYKMVVVMVAKKVVVMVEMMVACWVLWKVDLLETRTAAMKAVH